MMISEASRADGELTLPRLFGGRLLGWTWPLGAAASQLWFGLVAMAGAAAVLVMFGSVGLLAVFDPRPQDASGEGLLWIVFLTGFGPVVLLLLWAISRPLSSRWKAANQKLLLRWASARGLETLQRTRYLRFDPEERRDWPGDSVPTVPLVQSLGADKGFPTVARRLSEGREIFAARYVAGSLPLGVAPNRVWALRRFRQIDLPFVAARSLSAPAGLRGITCRRRGPSARAHARLVEHYEQQGLESIEVDRRFLITADRAADPIAVRRFIDPVLLEVIAKFDLSWELDGRWIVVYSPARVMRSGQLDEMAGLLDSLCRQSGKLEPVSPSPSAAGGSSDESHESRLRRNIVPAAILATAFTIYWTIGWTYTLGEAVWSWLGG